MESIAPTFSFTATLSRKLFSNGGLSLNRPNSCFVLANGYPSFLPLSSQKLTAGLRRRTSVIVAGKKNPNYKKKKADNHSFVSKPDESTGPFPEAVLLKQKKIQEDGKLLPEFADAEERQLYESLNLELESDLDVDQMRHYEVVYLIHENYVEEVESVNLKIQDFLREKKGKIWRFSDWGIRRLAYKIKKADFAHYILMNFELEAKSINEFKSLLDKDERVIRHLVIKMDEADTEECPPPPEFHTIRAGIDDEDDEEYEDDDDDEEYEDEDEDEDDDDDEEYEDDDDEEYDDDDDEEEYEDDDGDEVEDGDEERIIYVDEHEDGDDDSESISENEKVLVASGRRKSRTDEV